MLKRNWLLMIGILLSGTLVSACTSAEVSQEVDGPTVAVAAASATSVPTETTAPTETTIPATSTDVPVPTEVPVADQCVACHADHDLLVDTAAPVMVVESESEGEG
jgi:hypothetical protein